MNKKAVVLHSGGLDSTTALYLAISKGFEVYTISFDYGQRHRKELETAEKVAKLANVKEHQVARINLDAWGGSALTDLDIDIPKYKEEAKEIPVTYVPARNMIFLSVAASYAETIGARDIFIGVSQVDYSGYVDCREVFIKAMENAINLGTVAAVEKNSPMKVHAPFLHITKAEEIKIGLALNVPYEHTWSCYKGEEKPCMVCDSCMLRMKAFKEIGIVDPLIGY